MIHVYRFDSYLYLMGDSVRGISGVIIKFGGINFSGVWVKRGYIKSLNYDVNFSGFN